MLKTLSKAGFLALLLAMGASHESAAANSEPASVRQDGVEPHRTADPLQGLLALLQTLPPLHPGVPPLPEMSRQLVPTASARGTSS